MLKTRTEQMNFVYFRTLLKYFKFSHSGTTKTKVAFRAWQELERLGKAEGYFKVFSEKKNDSILKEACEALSSEEGFKFQTVCLKAPVIPEKFIRYSKKQLKRRKAAEKVSKGL